MKKIFLLFSRFLSLNHCSSANPRTPTTQTHTFSRKSLSTIPKHKIFGHFLITVKGPNTKSTSQAHTFSPKSPSIIPKDKIFGLFYHYRAKHENHTPATKQKKSLITLKGEILEHCCHRKTATHKRHLTSSLCFSKKPLFIYHEYITFGPFITAKEPKMKPKIYQSSNIPHLHH